jgi:hypothetical protein
VLGIQESTTFMIQISDTPMEQIGERANCERLRA